MEGYLVDQAFLEKEMLKLTDWYTDDLFHSREDDMIIADFSRIYCDPERFRDDNQETMARFGMGVIYETSDEGEKIRIAGPELKEWILENYYRKHHERLSEAVDQQLKLYGQAQIIDCHSFPDKPLKRDQDQNLNRPDFNIGTDSFHTPQHLIDVSVDFFKTSGFTLGIDWPYKGSIVPMKHYQRNTSVQTIMLEVNRSLYLDEPTTRKLERYEEIKQVTAEFIRIIKNSI
jgi:N-formylglutamate deformylase